MWGAVLPPHRVVWGMWEVNAACRKAGLNHCYRDVEGESWFL